MTVAVADDTQPSVINAVSASGGGASPATGTDATTVTQLPALVVTSFDTAGGVPYAPFTQGDGAAAGDDYHITVANDGFAATSGTVTLTVTVPAGLTALSMSGPGWSCHIATTTCTLTGGPLAAGQGSQITLAVAVSRDAPQSVPLMLQAAGGGELPAAAINTADHDGTTNNAGAKIDQTYITVRG